MLTPWQRQRVLQAIGASDLIQVGDQHMILMPVDRDILDYLAVWGSETEDDEDEHDREECCEDEGAQCDDEGSDVILVA